MDDSAPVFVRVLSSFLYEVPTVAGDLGWCGYLLGKNDKPPDEPITIPQTFTNYSGHYLFALERPNLTTEPDADTFITNVRNYIFSSYNNNPNHPNPNPQLCMWIRNPANLVTDFSGSYDFAFGAIGPFNVGMQSSLNNPIDFSITFSMQQNSLMFTYEQGLTIQTPPGTTSIFFQTNNGGTQFGPGISPNQIYIPFSGAYRGCFLFSGSISPNSTLASFETGFQYAHANAGSADSIQSYPLLLTDSSQPSFNYNGSLDPIDPLNLGAPTVNPKNGQLRTLFAPTGNPQFASWMQTNTNQSISLVPQLYGDGSVTSGPGPNSGAFAFESEAPASVSNADFYLAPVGDFALAVAGVPQSGAGAGAINDLLCGIFGSETISFRSYATDTAFDFLRFTAHQPAYAPIFPFATASLNNISAKSNQPRLNNTYTTSWATMVNGANGNVRYRAQPEASPLFTAPPKNTKAADDDISILSTYDADVKLPTDNFCFPIVPYSGVNLNPPSGFSAAEVSTFESQIISPTRKLQISEPLKPHMKAMKQMRRAAQAVAAPVDVTLTTTPQGLLAEVIKKDLGTDYVKVTLGVSDAPSEFSPNFAFNNIETELQNLLQTNQLFSVAVNHQYLGKLLNQKNPPNPPPPDAPSFENTATIAGWTFTAQIGEGASSTDYRNIMIFKFCEGTVQDLVNNPNKWISTEDFSIVPNAGDENIALIGLSTWLQNYIQTAIDMSATSTLYDNFVNNIVKNKNWNGILVLRADVNVSGFPDQIKGLAAGIDASHFEAHHFGVTVSRVTVNGTDIQMQTPSSLFGLIDYQQPLFRQNVASGGNPDTPLMVPVSGDYGFTVLQLQALFENAALVDFRSRIQLNVNRLFGSAVSQTYGQNGQSPIPAVVLKGSYQKQGKTSTYVFQQDNPTFFVLDSNALQAVTFDHVQFNTLTSDSGGGQSTIQSRFLIWGMLDFALIKALDKSDFDIFSFGSPEGTQISALGTGLSFSNLQINLQSPVATPNAITYTFASSGLAFDFAASSLRKDNTGALTDTLFSDLALQIDSFTAATGGKRPSDFGYLPVQTKISLAELSGDWYGIAFKVTMGTPGALVSGAGFESKMFLAWSPQTNAASPKYGVFVGLSLPGTAPGAKLLSLQGILKVSIDSIQLTHDTVQGTSDSAFVLRLNNIGLKFLGIVKLPPDATINFFLFGAPAGKGSLGWYAAYIEDSGEKQKTLADAEAESNLIRLGEHVGKRQLAPYKE